MAIEELNWAFKQRCFGDEKLLLLYLAAHAENRVAQVPLQDLANFIGRAESTTRRALTALQRSVLIERFPDGSCRLELGRLL